MSVQSDGYRGIWYMNQRQDDAYKFKYSGGFATYPQQHVPIAIYAKAVHKTFFVFGGKVDDVNRISNLVGCYDHASGKVSRPTVLVTRQTTDTHYNPTLLLDATGRVCVFANCHGLGAESDPSDPTHGKSYIFRSIASYSIDAFETVREDNFSYSQPWLVDGRHVWLHTRYERGRRRLFWASGEVHAFAEPQQLCDMAMGNYQISWANGSTIATAFDVHPEPGGLNARANLYYLQSADHGKTWTTAAGQKVTTPLGDLENPALVRETQREKLLVYLKDLTFDDRGRPVILYLTTHGFRSGPADGPRTWVIAHWTGQAWEHRNCFESDHNYDHGSLYLEPDGTWRIIAPTVPGPQPFCTGGQMAIHVSADQGRSWKQTALLPTANQRNATYARRPLNAHDDVYALWADGDALNESESDLYFCNKAGEVFRLPRKMSQAFEKPVRVLG